MRKFLTLLLLSLLISCQTESQDPLKKVVLEVRGEKISTTIVYSPEEQSLGLSGIKTDEFNDNQGMLFFNIEDEERNFWMPDTYFDLDLFYLDKDLKVIDIVRKLPHYIGRANPSLIPRARPVFCRHVLEMKASSAISQKIQLGDYFRWNSTLSLVETEKLIKQKLEF
jgi:uncharacterized membrane protein (UPF0127 family)